MTVSLTRLSGGNTPADGSDPRTFPAIWNASATAIENALAEGGGASVTVSPTAPVGPGDGDLWWDSDNGALYIYYNDGTSSQWVDAASPKVFVSDTAPTGYPGQLWLDSTDGSMYTYYTDPGGANSQWIGAVSRSGGILQVVSTTLTAPVSVSVTTAGTFYDVTGLSATITPRSTSSKIMVVTQISHSARTSGSNVTSTRLVRDSTAIAVGDAAGSRVQASSYEFLNDGGVMSNPSVQILDSPATTSSVTYKVQVSSNVSSQTAYINRSQTDTDSVGFTRTASTITLMEVAG